MKKFLKQLKGTITPIPLLPPEILEELMIAFEKVFKR